MEFIDEDTRPRFLYQSRSSNPSSPLPETLKISKLHLTICLSSATFLLITAFSLTSNTSITFYLLIWISLSLLLAPFAPPSLTGGNPTVGNGDPLPPPPPLPKPKEPEEPRRRPNSKFNPKPNIPSFSPAGVINPKPDEKSGVDPGQANIVDFSASGWSKVEDIALLNALKMFPKDAAMRWEKVAAAVEGKSKAECMKRVGELKRDFRSFKSSEK